MNKYHKKKGQGKTYAKAYGLKSVIKFNDNLAITTFGKKDDPTIVEHSINKNNGEKKYYIKEKPGLFDSKLVDGKNPEEKTVEISSTKKDFKFEVKDQSNSVNGMDLLRFKPKLEKEFFGNEFNDNLHIQIAYNLLDLKKIISLHVADAIESFTNLQRYNNNERPDDLIGTVDPSLPFANIKGKNPEEIEARKEKNKQFMRNVFNYNMYFDGIFKPIKEGDKNYIQNINYNYNIIRCLSLIRNGSAHSGGYLYTLYNFQNQEQYADLLSLINNITKIDFNNFNDSFNKNNGKNLFIIDSIFEGNKRELAQEFYNFVIYKENKNLGFKLKSLREMILNHLYDESTLTIKFASFRNKINTILDFYIYIYFKNNDKYVSDIVSKLREVMNDEKKEAVYEGVFHNLERNEKFINTCKKIVDKTEKTIKLNVFPQKFDIDKFKNKLHPFANIIYLLCKVLDGKEVNELVTSIINKLENIENLYKTALKLGIDVTLTDNYRIFNNNRISDLIADFRLVKNMTSTKRKLRKVSKDEAKVCDALFADAINIFKASKFVDAKNRDESGLSVYTNKFFNKSDKGNLKIRNFLINAVIKNRRFAYLIKYVDPRNVFKLVHKQEILQFVFDEKNVNALPLNQIKRYYLSISDNLNKSANLNNRREMVNEIIAELQKISIDKIFSFGERFKNGDTKFINKQKQLISLYLTVAYLVVKGIIHTNSIYFIAWACFERDHAIKFDVAEERNKRYFDKLDDYFMLLNAYMYNKKTRVQEFLQTNIDEATTYLSLKPFYRNYRNCVHHLNLCSTFIRYLDGIKDIRSYFDIYQYALQKWMVTQTELEFFKNDESGTGEALKCKLTNDLNNYGSYQRDFLKIANLPFAYNLARYKNLTIGDLFNDKYPLDKKVHDEYYGEKNK